MLETPATITAINNMGPEPITTTPEGIAEVWPNDLTRLGPIIKQAKIEPQ